MRILVAYMSVTGNTRKVAEAIYDVITEEKEIGELKDLESLEGYDLIFLGFPFCVSKIRICWNWCFIFF